VDRVENYWELLLRVMREQERLSNINPVPGIELLLTIDPERRIIHLQEIGWRDHKRVIDTYIVARIKDGKIWIEDDGTEEGIANELVAAGVPKLDIVLAFQPPERRHLTEFAVA
jgi:XisI protein